MERQPQPKSSDRAAFVEWFYRFADENRDHPRQIAKFAAQAVEKACEALAGCRGAVPWHAAMGGDADATETGRQVTAGVSGIAESDPTIGDEERGRSDPSASVPARTAEPPQHCQYCQKCFDQIWDSGHDTGAYEAYADCERIAREIEVELAADLNPRSNRAHKIVVAIESKRKEVCGEP